MSETTIRPHWHHCASAKRDFLPQPDPKFTCWDIRELQLEKTVAYAQALQFWAEKANLPTQGQPHLLAGSVLELREEIKCYISFPDEAVFSGVALPEESLATQSEDTVPKNAQPTYVDSPAKEAAVKATKKNHLEGSSPLINSQGGGRCYTPPGWSLLLGRFLPSLRTPGRGHVIGALVGRLLNTSGQMISWRLKTPNQSPCHQQGY